MNAKDTIAATLDTSSFVLGKYIEDLSDTELLTRPGEGCNHVAWQLGHLIASEAMLLNMLVPGAAPELPEGFAEKHSKDNTDSDDAADFCTKAEYMEQFDRMHAATKSALDGVSEADLDQPAPENFRAMFPTVGAMWILLATHPLMHAGQVVPVRRKLGKPVLI